MAISWTYNFLKNLVSVPRSRKLLVVGTISVDTAVKLTFEVLPPPPPPKLAPVVAV